MTSLSRRLRFHEKHKKVTTSSDFESVEEQQQTGGTFLASSTSSMEASISGC
jgi:hypothetical protein